MFTIFHCEIVRQLVSNWVIGVSKVSMSCGVKYDHFLLGSESLHGQSIILLVILGSFVPWTIIVWFSCISLKLYSSGMGDTGNLSTKRLEIPAHISAQKENVCVPHSGTSIAPLGVIEAGLHAEALMIYEVCALLC